MINMNLKSLLTKKGFNQKQFSELTNIRPNTISGYCNNTFTLINKEHLDKMCEILECDIPDLIEYKPLPKIEYVNIDNEFPHSTVAENKTNNYTTEKTVKESDSETFPSYKLILEKYLKNQETREKITDSVMKILLDTSEDNNQKDKDDE